MICELKKGNLKAAIDPEDGMNVLSLKFCLEECVHVDENKRKARFKTYGIPILFPTPNRTRNEQYSFDGVRYPATMHGNLKHLAFSVIECTESSIVGAREYDGSDPLFPFKATITVTISLEDDTLSHCVRIENNDLNRFGYGLALHPFFVKQPGSTMMCNVESQMVTTEDKLPTGECRAVEGTELDFNVERSTSELAFDTVFICRKSLECRYSTPSYVLDISASEAYDHVVLYTTKEAPFICFEPQTCSTDLFNMAAKGFEKEAHLLTLDPGESSEHRVDFRFRRRS